MRSMEVNKVFFLFTLIVFTGVRAQYDVPSGTENPDFSETGESNLSVIDVPQLNLTDEPITRFARATNQQVTLSTPAECYRHCDGSQPRYCYYKFHLEYYTTMGPACNQCRTDSFARSKNQSTCQCVLADGVEKTIFSINRRFPGPSIQVCQYDKIIVDVENKAEGTDTTIHWHGIFQNLYQYYDGVPHVTQCPISAPNTFRYQFSADNPGTHFYHSHSSLFLIDGQQGSLVVRAEDRKTPNRHLYDFDLYDHVIMLSDWLHELSLEKYPGHYARDRGQAAENILINGHGRSKTGEITPWAYFGVQSGKRYRFRMISSFGSVCPSEITIEKHKMIVIATDGEDLEPVTVDKIVLTSGERYDFVLNADQSGGSYWIQVRGLAECADKKILQVAVLTYNNQLKLPNTPIPTFDNPLTGTVELNPLEASQCMNKKKTNKICINQLKYGSNTPKEEKPIMPFKRIYIPFSFFTYNNKVFTIEKFDPFYIAIDKALSLGLVSNVSYSEPPSPVISQYEGYEKLCTADRVPTCTRPCLCSHVINLPKDKLIEIVLCDEDPFNTLHHPFHLHGYSFQVMAIRDFGGRKPTQQDIFKFVQEHDRALQAGEYVRQPRKDTIKIPVGGCAILRFYTNNPGWWLFHCHFSWHTVAGMNVLIHVGEESDMPPVPDGFPVCGDYRPPVYI